VLRHVGVKRSSFTEEIGKGREKENRVRTAALEPGVGRRRGKGRRGLKMKLTLAPSGVEDI